MVSYLSQLKRVMLLTLCLIALAGCGTEAAARPSPSPFVPPTAPPTPANFGDVPDAATAAARRSIVPATGVNANGRPSGTAGPTATPATATLPDNPEGQERDLESAPDKVDPTTLAKLLGSPGPGSLPGGTLPTLVGGTSGRSNRSAPTPTLNTSPSQSKIEALRQGKISFLTAYRQALGRVQQADPEARLAFASANILRPERSTWSFLFISSNGQKMWKVIYDSTGPKLDMNEQAPAMQADAALIDMKKVLDGDALLRKAESAGLKLSWPVDIFNFQVEGVTRQPCFIMTNVSQGKQVAINAYTGAVVRDDFIK